MTTRFARFESCCRSWLMRSFRRAAKPAFANKSKWPAFPPSERLRRPSNSNSMKVMADIDPKLVKQLREKTNAGMMDCKRALEEAGSDLARAETILRTKGIASEREIYKAQVKGKPANVTEKIVDGKLDKFYSTVCLLEQGFIKNPDVTIKDLLSAKIAELGENIVIRRFTRYLVGEPLAAEA